MGALVFSEMLGARFPFIRHSLSVLPLQDYPATNFEAIRRRTTLRVIPRCNVIVSKRGTFCLMPKAGVLEFDAAVLHPIKT